MCPHGNFPGGCEACSKEQVGDYADIRRYIETELSAELSEGRAKELTEELATVASFMERAGVDFYLAGGSGLDLLDGTWSRDHQDVDAAISSQDVAQLYDAAIADGYILTDPQRNELSREQIVDGGLHNAFLFRADANGVSEFEVMFLPQTDEGMALVDGVVIPKEAYDQMSPTVRVGDHDVTLQPPEVILFYKITDGRRKDLADVKKTWAVLGDDQRGQVQVWIGQAGFRFGLQGTETDNVEELLKLAGQEEAEKTDTFFSEGVSKIEALILGDFGEVVQAVWDIRQVSPSREQFFEQVAKRYGGFVPERRKIIETIADYLFEQEEGDFDTFEAWARDLVEIDERIKPRALHEYTNEKIWEVKS